MRTVLLSSLLLFEGVNDGSGAKEEDEENDVGDEQGCGDHLSPIGGALPNQKRVLTILTNKKRVLTILTNQKRVLTILTNKKRVLTK